jgi:predicted transposase YdaD
MQTYDKLWKGIIEDLAEDCLLFYYPDLAVNIDFGKGIEFLDQELIQLFPEAEKNNRTIDKLLKVYLLNGTEEWVLIHIEVQGYEDNFFEQRMFTYFYRIFDRYQKAITALAILTDKKKDYQPHSFQREFYGTRILYEFCTYKVLEQSKEALGKSDNPFALVVLATLEAIEKGKLSDTAVMQIKRNLARLLLERNYEKLKIIALFKFIQNYIRFENKENYSIFAKHFYSTYQPNQKNMGVVDILIEDARQEGIDLGIEKGIDLGIEKGIDLGIEKGIDLGIEKNTYKIVENILQKFPTWEDNVIADLAATTETVVQEIRMKLGK